MPVSKRRKPKKGRHAGPKVHGGPRLVTPNTAASLRDLPGLPADMRAMERVTASIVPGRSGKRGKELDLQDAQDLIYDAWETADPRDRVRLANEALLRSDDCADAYVIFAEEIPGTLEQKREMYTAGVEAGERAIGQRAFKEDVGHFWGLLETRPYMRARAGLAACLWQLGEREEAVAHYRDMLRLNPNDNQGIRYTLSAACSRWGPTIKLPSSWTTQSTRTTPPRPGPTAERFSRIDGPGQASEPRQSSPMRGGRTPTFPRTCWGRSACRRSCPTWSGSATSQRRSPTPPTTTRPGDRRREPSTGSVPSADTPS